MTTTAKSTRLFFMPGITGIIRKARYADIDRDLDLMVGVLCHDPGSSTGKYVDESIGLWIGWVCHSGSYSDCLPLVAANRDVVIVFQGEHYASREQVSRLRQAGFSAELRKATDLLDLHSVYGSELYRNLNGWFSGVLVDRAQQTVTLFNDRYAMGRIYYHETEEEFIFSSEAKSLLKVRPKLRKVDNEAFAEHLRYSCVLGHRSLFAGIRRLPHASAWSFRGGSLLGRRQYFDFREWEQQPTMRSDEFYESSAKTIRDVFPAYAEGSQKVALSPTAGLDSRLILAVLRERNREHPAYTYGGAWGELFDVRTARKAAHIYGQSFEAIRITDRFLKEFDGYATRAVQISDGCHDAFGAHDVFFSEIARAIAPVRLTGKFGSEIMRIHKLVGTNSYKRGLLQNDLQALVERLPHFQAINSRGNQLTRVVTEEISSYEYARIVVEQAYLTMRTPYMDNALVKLMYQAPSGARSQGDVQERCVKDFAPECATFITNMGRFSSSSAFLTKLAYYPFKALFKMEYVYLVSAPHWMTRVDHALTGWHLERLFSGRQKWEGYRLWIKTHLADFIRDTLLNPQAEYTEHFDYSTVSRMVRQHVAGTHNHLLEINRALSLQLVYSSLLKS